MAFRWRAQLPTHYASLTASWLAYWLAERGRKATARGASPEFLSVPNKHGVNKLRLIIIDIRPLNQCCEERNENFTRLRHPLGCSLDPGTTYMLSMNLEYGFYAFVIAPEDRDYFTIDYRGKI